MRVIGGSVKRLKLKTLEGLETRPTTDRIKETLFNVISSEIPDSVFLDLFCGSGAIGIEALSRGAKEAVFVDYNPKAIICLKENLQHTKLTTKAYVIQKDVISGLKQLEGKKIFDFIFLDPPYDLCLEKPVFQYLISSDVLHENTVIITESSKGTEFGYLEDLGFSITRVKEYKTNKHTFVMK